MKTSFTKKYVFILLGACVVGFIGVNAVIFLAGNTPLWHADEMSQYNSRFVYFGRLVRHAFASLVAGQGFDFPGYTLNVGYGSDVYSIIVGLLTDPFNVLAIVCPARFAEYFIVFLIFARVAACAFTFSFYCFQRGRDRKSTFIASLCYAFGGFLIFWGAMRHPSFLATAMMFPLLVAGADHVFEGRKPWLFIGIAALQFAKSVYFAFMVFLMLLVYCLIKYFFGEREKSPADFAKLVGRFILLIAIAFCVSAILCFPKIISLLSQERLGLDRYSTLLHDLGRYLAYPTDLIGATTYTKAAYIGGFGVVALSAFLLFRERFSKKEHSAWLIGLVLVTICMVFPYPTRVLNGFSYATDRWMFAADFCLAYIVCLTVPVLFELKKRDWARIGIACGIFVAICLIMRLIIGSISPRTGIMIALFAASVVVLALAFPRTTGKVKTGIASIIVIVSISAATCLYCSPLGDSFAKNFIDMGSMRSIIFTNNPAAAVDGLKDTDRYRYSLPNSYNSLNNSSLNHKSYGIDFYNSDYSQPVDSLRTQLGVSDDFFNIRFVGSQGRLAIDALTGAKYYVSKDSNAWRVPFSYEKTNIKKNKYKVYETDHALPIAFSTKYAISKSAFADLTMTEKQEALLQGCVVDDEAAEGFTQPEIGFASHPIEYTLSAGDGITVEEGRIVVKKAQSTITLKFEGDEKCETYVQLLNLHYGSFLPSELAELNGKDSSGMFMKDALSTYPTEYSIEVKSGDNSRTFNFGTNRHAQYGGKKNWILNMGYSEQPKTEFVLTFAKAGEYTFDDLSIICQPVEPLVSEIDAMAEGNATDFSFAKNTVTASFSTADDHELAVFTIPYSTGWTAWVDGKQTEIERADTAFMAVALQGSGEHTVVLQYTTRGFGIGATISLVGVVALVGLILFERKRRPRHAR